MLHPMKKRLAFILMIAALGTSSYAQNLLSNGSFESDFANWQNLAGGTSSASFAIETIQVQDGAKAMRIQVNTPGANAWDVQSIHSGWPSETSKQYTLSFYAKATANGLTLRAVQQTTTYSQRDFNLTTSYQKYEWTITAQEPNLKLRFNFPAAGTFYIDNVSIVSADNPPAYIPPGPPIATGKSKFLGSAYSSVQKVNFAAYFNQVTPENDGKWGAVEATRDVMNWAGMDSAYKLAKDKGFPFKMHTLIWGNQQPAWIENLSPAEQLEEIEEWFAAVASRYPAIEIVEVVNEPINDPPNSAGNGGGNYIYALGGYGLTGYDWIINAFKLARKHFGSGTRLWINEYNIVNSIPRTQQYLNIANLLKSENLIDGIGVQAHAFSTTATSATITANLNTLATAGLPLYATELDIDGLDNQVQLDAYKRIFPLFWEHPAIKGVTLWGHRPGHWRTAQGAYIVLENGIERPAMEWLKGYVAGTVLPTYTWTGNVSTDWGNPSNWSSGLVPNQISDVAIPAGRPRYPSVNISTTINSLFITPGTSVTTGQGVTLAILSN
jgi:GH35 family endo-1,4-beta-xylanase